MKKPDKAGQVPCRAVVGLPRHQRIKGVGSLLLIRDWPYAGPTAGFQRRLQAELLRRASLPGEIAERGAADDRTPQTFEFRFGLSPVDE